MLLVGAFPMPPVSVYIRPTGAGCSRSVKTITKAADDEIIAHSSCHEGRCEALTLCSRSGLCATRSRG
jgi:hypothetical protein